MSDIQTNMQDIRLDVELLKKDVSQSQYFIQKLADSIEKIQEANTNLVKMISLHEQKHEQHEKDDSSLKEQLKDLHDRLDQLELHMERKIDVLRADIMAQKAEKENKTFVESMKEIDKYKWMIIGGAVSVIWVVNNINLTSLANLFK